MAPDRRFTFFDQVHTTGMDIKQCIDACAATTLGKDMTLRDHSQGIYRMRGLAKGQIVHLLIVPEVLDLIQHAVARDKPFLSSNGDPTHSVRSKILRWMKATFVSMLFIGSPPTVCVHLTSNTCHFVPKI